jgi:predicted metal-dependent phosphoesterase TrpH
MVFDLHSHSHCSDGALSPAALLARAAEQGVDALAITDHDTVAAFAQLPAAGSVAVTPGVTVIPGVEFSTTWNSVGIHVLGLNIDPASTAMVEGVAAQSAAREQRGAQIGEKLRKLGIENAFEGARSHAGGGQVGRPHFARHLVASGVVDDVEAAFKKYLGAGKPGDVREHWAPLAQVVEWIRGAGGVAVLAHPLKYKLTRTRLKRLLDSFTGSGGEGMEVVSGQQSAFQTRDMGQLCLEKSLLGSAGSDFHAPGSQWSELGRFHALPERVTPVWERF